jgi:hypothetical protein
VTTTPKVTQTTTPQGTFTTTPQVTQTTTPKVTQTTTPQGTVTTTPQVTQTTTPKVTQTTTPEGTVTTTPKVTTIKVTTPVNPCAPQAKFQVDKVAAKEKGQSLIQRMRDTPITSGLFGFLLASAVIGFVVRFVASCRRSSRVTFAGRAITAQEGSFDSFPGSDLESNQAFIE